MALDEAKIESWCRTGREHEKLEFKEAKEQVSYDRLCEYCVAIANEGGGDFVLGITNAQPRRVVGTKAIDDPVGMRRKLQQTLGFRVEIEEFVHPDGRVVAVGIPSRPRGTAYQLNGRYLMRAGESIVPMTEDRLRSIFSEGRPDWLEEHSKVGLDAQAVVELLDTQAYYSLIQRPFPSDRAGVIDRLLRERLVDDAGGTFAIRRLGALLLARSLDEFPDVARKAVRVVVYSGASKLHTKLDQLGTKGYAVGFQGLVRFVMEQLPQNEVIEDALRKAVKLVPETVIRELVANALIHQDFLLGGASVMIEVYDDRVELTNPGEPIVAVERFIDGYQSRNERLADQMRRMGICEEKGSGIDRVVSTVELLQLPAPEFRAGTGRTLVRLFGPRSFETMDREDRVRACHQHCVLKWVMSQRMTNQTLRERFRLPESKSAVASQVIAATIEAGLIKADTGAGGSRKFARYLPIWG